MHGLTYVICPDFLKDDLYPHFHDFLHSSMQLVVMDGIQTQVSPMILN